MSIELSAKIEGLLFYKGEDLSVKKISELLNVSVEEIEEALKKLEQTLLDRGLVLLRKDENVTLAVNSELGSLIESIHKDEITKELTKSSLETLSIILYKNGATRGEIDYIRGVNSSFILRNLLVRGLIEKIVDPKDSRRFIYRPTFDSLSFMGITSINDLPNYDLIKSQLDNTIENQENNA